MNELAVIEAEIIKRGYNVTPQMIDLVTDWIVGIVLDNYAPAGQQKTVKIRPYMIADKFGIENGLAKAINEAIFKNPPRRLRLAAGPITWEGKPV